MNKWTVLKLLQKFEFLLSKNFVHQLQCKLIIYLMSLVIEGGHLHRLCLMCNPIGYCIYAFIQ